MDKKEVLMQRGLKNQEKDECKAGDLSIIVKLWKKAYVNTLGKYLRLYHYYPTK